MITLAQIKSGMPWASDDNIKKYGPELIATMIHFEINTPPRVCAFLAQIGHESGSLRYVRELASGKAYDTGTLAKNLGNTPEADGDGEKYKGRGLIQITGRANYKLISNFFGEDFLNHPELLETPKYAALSAGWFWNRHELNDLADLDTVESFKSITKAINGGLNGFEARVSFWRAFKQVLQ